MGMLIYFVIPTFMIMTLFDTIIHSDKTRNNFCNKVDMDSHMQHITGKIFTKLVDFNTCIGYMTVDTGCQHFT